MYVSNAFTHTIIRNKHYLLETNRRIETSWRNWHTSYYSCNKSSGQCNVYMFPQVVMSGFWWSRMLSPVTLVYMCVKWTAIQYWGPSINSAVSTGCRKHTSTSYHWQYCPLGCDKRIQRYLYTELHGFTFQKIVIFVVIGLKTANLTCKPAVWTVKEW